MTGRSSAPPERVFELLADAPGWSSWAGPLIMRSWWESEGDPAPGGVGAIRRFGLGRLSSREEIMTYAPPLSMSYRVLGGLPVKDYFAKIQLSPDGDGTAIEWSGVFTPKVAGSAMLLTFFLRRMIGGFVRRAAAAVEKG